MTFKQVWKREKYVAIHAQTWRFRVVKYLVLAGILWATYSWKGWSAVGLLLAILLILSLGIHFLFRYKTEAWTKSWGPYKKIALPED